LRAALAGLLAAAFTLAGPGGPTPASGTVAPGIHPSTATKVFTLDPSMPGNNPEGVAWDSRTRQFFVGTVGTGTIYRATLHDKKLRPFVTPDPAAPADSAVGMKVAGGKLFVAGGGTGSIYVYKIKTGALLARYETGEGGFLNDLVVTAKGDVYVTDSFRPTLWHLTPGMVKARKGTPEAIAVGPEIAYTAGAFNLNGIVDRRGGRELIVVNSSSKSLFRIDINPKKTSARVIKKIKAPALGGDGLLIDQGRLLVVTGNPAKVTVLRLSNRDLRARVDAVLSDPTLRGPSTIARAKNRYLVVNADFADNAQPYTVSSLLRRHGGAHP
jgi:sugar lactone lactonase YvrE